MGTQTTSLLPLKICTSLNENSIQSKFKSIKKVGNSQINMSKKWQVIDDFCYIFLAFLHTKDQFSFDRNYLLLTQLLLVLHFAIIWKLVKLPTKIISGEKLFTSLGGIKIQKSRSEFNNLNKTLEKRILQRNENKFFAWIYGKLSGE